MRFSPNGRFIYLLNELALSVTVYAWDRNAGTARLLTTVPALSDEVKAGESFNSAAEIVVHPEGRFVFSSNRGHDSVAIFTVEESGILAHAGWTSTLGRIPRFVGFDPSETLLYAANQGSNNIAAFRLNQSNGALSPTGYVVEVGAPTCIAFKTPGSV